MSTDKRTRLPVDFSDIRGVLSENQISQLEQLNQQHSILKEQLKQLDLEKGIVSRKIGEAKKQNQPIEPLKQTIQQLSRQIDTHKTQLNELARQAETLLPPPATGIPDTPAFPSHLARSQQGLAPSGSISIIAVDDTHNQEWDAFAYQHPESNAYHQYAFRRVIETSFGHRTIYLAAKDGQGSFCGILPAVQINSRIFGNYLVAVPFFNYGGALAVSDEIEHQLMGALNQQANNLGASHVEYRDTTSRPGLPQKTDKASLILKLPTQADQLWQDIGTKVRAQIKKADSFDLVFKSGKQELLDDFYKVFATNMRDLGTPVYAKSFFANLLKEPALDTRLALAYCNNKPVSCGFLLSYHGTQEIPWASTLREANTQNANMFLYWNILKQAVETGHLFFDFGRSSKDAGTFKFKQQWGAKPSQLYWHYWLKNGGELPALNPNNPKFKLAIALWQRMPIWLTTLLGPYIVKNLP